MGHAYPQQLAYYLQDRWEDPFPGSEPLAEGEEYDPLPDPSVLEYLLSACFQASLLREEDRPVTFRLVLRPPTRFADDDGPPLGLHRLEFSRPRPFNEHELRRLSPAVDFYRGLIGASFDEREGLQIWGLVWSGPRWIQAAHGGRHGFHPLPQSLVVSVLGPGQVTVAKGSVTLGKLRGGAITHPTMDVFDSNWLRQTFAAARDKLNAVHREARDHATTPWAPLDPEISRLVPQHMVRRLISAMQSARHGGTLVMLPPELTGAVTSENRFLSLKYVFQEEEPRKRFHTLLIRLMNALAETFGETRGAKQPVGWAEYVASRADALAQTDEAIIEFAHLVAGLSAVDGAVVLSKEFELLGFGGEILGEQENVLTVARALDAEGERTIPERTESVGTRHRSVYRLCQKVPDALAIVVSQDGGVRFVKNNDGVVTYWDQVATSVLNA